MKAVRVHNPAGSETLVYSYTLTCEELLWRAGDVFNRIAEDKVLLLP